MKWLTRLNILFFSGNSILLALEIMNPFFGYWHGISEAMIILFSLVSGRGLHHYSTRMINDLWVYADGKHVEVAFMNAYFIP